ncbi:MAG: hypothetical protein ACI8SR_002866 [Oceanicoccus sp.]|jgi:hypothetical protein
MLPKPYFKSIRAFSKGEQVYTESTLIALKQVSKRHSGYEAGAGFHQ